MRRVFTTIMLSAALLTAGNVAAATIGYTNGNHGRGYIFRSGSTEKQGVAIKLGPEKLAMLKGRTISAIETEFGTRNAYNGMAHLFITTDPDSDTPIVEQDVKISKVAEWVTCNLDNPYTITGDEGALYIGYTLEADAKTQPLPADYSQSTKGVCFAYKDGEWADMYSLNVGCANVKAVIDDGEGFTDLMLKTLGYEGYRKAGASYAYGGQLLNIGTETVNSFDISIQIGDSEPVVTNYKDLSIAQGSSFDFTLPDYAATMSGSLPVTVTVSNVNGAADDDSSDNTQEETMFFYPEDMERSLLLEGFTGQECPNCPTGHAKINSFLQSTEYEVVEVMHHIGYYPDIYTMAADDSYLLFYGGSSTYAPAFMMNRATIESLDAQPVLNPNETKDYLNPAAAYIAGRQPYVSLKLESDYDEATREVTVHLEVYAHNDLPEGDNLLNVMLVQDSITGYQSNGGRDYTHTKVFRGTLTGNPWGKVLPDDFKAGSTAEFDTTFVMPEAIFSDYWESETLRKAKGYSVDSVTIPTDPEQTYIVAYVGAYGGNSDYNGHEVYNCAEVKLGQSHTQGGLTGIAAAPAADDADVRIKVNGRRIKVEGCDSYRIYNVAGNPVPTESDLQRGIYIVRATADGRQTTKKIVIK